MQLTLAYHPVTEIHFGPQTRLDGTTLVIDPEELRRVVLEDETIESVNFEIVRPGENCRAGPIFDIVQPRAKETGSSPDFPGILGPPTSAGMGTTHVLEGAAVSVSGGKIAGRVEKRDGPGLGDERAARPKRRCTLRCNTWLSSRTLEKDCRFIPSIRPTGKWA